jgi:hypothetical protein
MFAPLSSLLLTQQPHTSQQTLLERVCCIPQHRANATSLISVKPKQRAAAHARCREQQQTAESSSAATEENTLHFEQLHQWSLYQTAGKQHVQAQVRGHGLPTAQGGAAALTEITAAAASSHACCTDRNLTDSSVPAGRGRMTTCLMRQRRAGAARAGAGMTTPLLLPGKQ